MSEQNLGNDDSTADSHGSLNRRSYLKTIGATGSGLALGGLGLEETAIESAHAAPTVIDDFEDSDLSEYDFDRGSSGASVVSSPAYNGSGVLEISGTNTEMISTSGLSYYPSAGDTFSYWVRGTGGADDINLTYGVQDHDNRYFIRVDFANNDLVLYRNENSDPVNLAGTDLSLSEDTWYEVEVDWGDSGSQVVTLYDSSGSQLGQISASDSTWTSGGIGYDAYFGSSGGSAYFDYITTESSGGDSGGSTSKYTKSNVDTFENTDKNLDAYRFDRGKSAAGIVTETESTGTQVYGPTYSGTQALKIGGSTATEMISLPGDGLPDYPEAGDNIACYIKTTGGADNFNFSWGVQGHQNRYYAKLRPEADRMYLFKYKDGNGTVLASESGLSMSQDTWYWIEIEWGADGTQTVELYDLDGNTLAECTGSDSEWSTGGVGFDAYIDSGEAVHFDECAIVKNEGQHKGGWGTVAVPSYGECCPNGTSEDGTWYNVDNFVFYLDYGGNFTNEKDGQIIHDFQVSGTFHTHEVEKPFTPDPTTDDLQANSKQINTKVKATVSDSASVTPANDNYTWAYGLGGLKYENWKSDESNYIEKTPSFDDFKTAAENNALVSDAGSVNDFFLEGLWFATNVVIGRFSGDTAFAMGLIELLGGFGDDPEPNCDYVTDDAKPDVELSEWYWCNSPISLVSASRSLRVAVPKGDGNVTLNIKQLVGGQGDPQDDFLTENLCKWEITCPDEEKNAYGTVTKEYGDF